MDVLQKILFEAKRDSTELHIECRSTTDNLNNLQITAFWGGGLGNPYKAFTAVGHGGKIKFVEVTNIIAIEYKGERYELISDCTPSESSAARMGLTF